MPPPESESAPVVVTADGERRADPWRPAPERWAGEPGDWIVPATRLAALPPEGRHAGRPGALVDPGEPWPDLDWSALPLVVVRFGGVLDGRGYSAATRLRAAGYAGDLRAEGPLPRDQAHALVRVGFTSFRLPAATDLDDWVQGLSGFGQVYQEAADGRTPIRTLRAAETRANPQDSGSSGRH